MTLREINAILREDELAGEEMPNCRLVGLLSVLRSMNQGERATDEGVNASVNKFVERYGPITTDSVDAFMLMPSLVIDVEIPDEYIIEMMKVDDLMKPEDMNDAELCAYRDASTILHIMQDAGVPEALGEMHKMTPEEQNDFGDAVDCEIGRRAEAEMAGIAAHVIEQEDAAEADGKPRDRYQLMRRRAAALLKLMTLNAPDVIVENAFTLLAET